MKLSEVKPIFDRMDLCGCGTNAHWVVIKMLLEKAENHDKNGSFYDPKDAEVPWIEFGAKVLDSWELTEHGTGIGWAWLTDDGKIILEWLRKYGLDDGDSENPKWPEGWDHGQGCPCGCENLEVL